MDKWSVDAWVDEVAKTPVTGFYPTATAKDTELPLNIVFDRLIELVHDGKLDLLFETRCSKCFQTLSETEVPPLGENMYCMYCDEDVVIEPYNVFPLFRITKQYKESLKKNKGLTLLGRWGKMCRRHQLKTWQNRQH